METVKNSGAQLAINYQSSSKRKIKRKRDELIEREERIDRQGEEIICS
jgi:hypothetical protein